MRRFIYHFFGLALIFVLVIVVTFKVENKIISDNIDLKLEGDITSIVLGHSHSACSLNDSMIEGVKNYSLSDEAYYYAYFKLKKLLEQNSHVKNVFVEFTNNNLDPIMNDWIWDEKHITNRFPLYSPFIENSGLLILAQNNLSGFLAGVSVSLKENLTRIKNNDYKYENEIGGYLFLGPSHIDSIKKVITTPGCEDVYVVGDEISMNSLHYLKKIIDYSKSKGCKVYLIRSPQHILYKSLKNEELFSEMRKRYFPKVPFLDFEYAVRADSCFRDLEHLNFKGAKKFSKDFNLLLKDSIQ